jgi:hypothetical protein
MVPSEPVLAFFRSEFQAEERNGFARLRRVPDSRVEESLGWYQSLSAADRASFIDLAAHYAHRLYGFVVGAPVIDHAQHPFCARWADPYSRFPFRSQRNVMTLRLAVSQYKMDRRRGVPSCISEELFRFAESVRSVKAAQLRQRLRAVLEQFGYEKTDDFGGHRCVWDGQAFQVNVDFGSSHAQLRYGVTMPGLSERAMGLGGGEFCFETVFGMGLGWWNYIVEENVDDAFELLAELLRYLAELPKRLRAAVSTGAV